MSKAPSKRTRAAARSSVKMGAGEFKAKCLAVIDEVNSNGHEVIITKRGKPTAKLVPFEAEAADEIFGRLKGIVTIVGDPDDLVNPIIPLEDWDSLK